MYLHILLLHEPPFANEATESRFFAAFVFYMPGYGPFIFVILAAFRTYVPFVQSEKHWKRNAFSKSIET